MLIWGGLCLTSMIGLWREADMLRAQTPTIASSPTQLLLDKAGQVLRLHREDTRWLIDGNNANSEAITLWLMGLSHLCQGGYPLSEIDDTALHLATLKQTDLPHSTPSLAYTPITLKIDDKEYLFAGKHPYLPSHALIVDKRLYWCDESIKATLWFAESHWLDAASQPQKLRLLQQLSQ